MSKIKYYDEPDLLIPEYLYWYHGGLESKVHIWICSFVYSQKVYTEKPYEIDTEFVANGLGCKQSDVSKALNDLLHDGILYPFAGPNEDMSGVYCISTHSNEAYCRTEGIWDGGNYGE